MKLYKHKQLLLEDYLQAQELDKKAREQQQRYKSRFRLHVDDNGQPILGPVVENGKVIGIQSVHSTSALFSQPVPYKLNGANDLEKNGCGSQAYGAGFYTATDTAVIKDYKFTCSFDAGYIFDRAVPTAETIKDVLEVSKSFKKSNKNLEPIKSIFEKHKEYFNHFLDLSLEDYYYRDRYDNSTRLTILPYLNLLFPTVPGHIRAVGPSMGRSCITEVIPVALPIADSCRNKDEKSTYLNNYKMITRIAILLYNYKKYEVEASNATTFDGLMKALDYSIDRCLTNYGRIACCTGKLIGYGNVSDLKKILKKLNDDRNVEFTPVADILFVLETNKDNLRPYNINGLRESIIEQCFNNGVIICDNNSKSYIVEKTKQALLKFGEYMTKRLIQAYSRSAAHDIFKGKEDYIMYLIIEQLSNTYESYSVARKYVAEFVDLKGAIEAKLVGNPYQSKADLDIVNNVTSFTMRLYRFMRKSLKEDIKFIKSKLSGKKTPLDGFTYVYFSQIEVEDGDVLPWNYYLFDDKVHDKLVQYVREKIITPEKCNANPSEFKGCIKKLLFADNNVGREFLIWAIKHKLFISIGYALYRSLESYCKNSNSGIQTDILASDLLVKCGINAIKTEAFSNYSDKFGRKTKDIPPNYVILNKDVIEPVGMLQANDKTDPSVLSPEYKVISTNKNHLKRSIDLFKKGLNYAFNSISKKLNIEPRVILNIIDEYSSAYYRGADDYREYARVAYGHQNKFNGARGNVNKTHDYFDLKQRLNNYYDIADEFKDRLRIIGNRIEYGRPNDESESLSKINKWKLSIVCQALEGLVIFRNQYLYESYNNLLDDDELLTEYSFFL